METGAFARQMMSFCYFMTLWHIELEHKLIMTSLHSVITILGSMSVTGMNLNSKRTLDLESLT